MAEEVAKRPLPTNLPVARLQVKLEREEMELDALKSALTDLKDIIVEFTRTAVSNPATGFVLAMVTTDVLYRMKVIDQGTANLVMGALLAAFAVDITVEVSGILSGVFGGSSSTGGNVDLIKPVTTTVVNSPTSGKSGNDGLAKRLLSMLPGGGVGVSTEEVAAGAAAV